MKGRRIVEKKKGERVQCFKRRNRTRTWLRILEIRTYNISRYILNASKLSARKLVLRKGVLFLVSFSDAEVCTSFLGS